MLFVARFTLTVLLTILLARASAGTSSPFTPSAWPLAVKGPYLNSWQSGTPGGASLPRSSPAFWPAWDDQTMWTCIVVVDNMAYMIMGSSTLPNVTDANQNSVSFTSTTTTFTLSAGPVGVNVTFLSPVTPNDLVRQSMPFAYLYLDLSSSDGAAHDIRVYSDIIPQWLHGNEILKTDPDVKVAANGSLITSSDFIGLQMQLQSPQPFTEVADHAQDVIGVFAMKSGPSVKYQIGTDSDVRALGINATGLQNTIDTNYSSHSLDNPFDAFAITVDLGTIQSTSEPLVWTVGMLRDPSINLTTAAGAEQIRSSYYWSNFSTIPEIISFVLNDSDTARSTAEAFDQMIESVPLSHIAGYTDLLALATRQIFGTLEITLSKSGDGSWNQSDVMVFSKDMGDLASIGSSSSTNAVDVLYAGFPSIMFLCPNLGKYILRPILESQFVGGNPVGQAYAPQNLGAQFPSASSNISPHNMGIEQSGNMIIMMVAYMQTTNDLSLSQHYYTLLKQWADYLTNETLSAGHQTASLSDGLTSFNQTNLVLKGIVGISAMSVISDVLGETNDQKHYQDIAQSFLQVWLNSALSQDHSQLLSSFGDPSSGGLIYNMYADKLLGLNLIPSNITSIQSGYYESLLSTNKTPFGIPLDSSDSSLTRLDWTMFAIASVFDEANNPPALFQTAISMLQDYATPSSSSLNEPLAIAYNPANGSFYSGGNSFAIGALFAPLVFGNSSSLEKTANQIGQDKSSSKGVIVGAVVGGVCALAVSAVGIWLWLHKFGHRGDRILPEGGQRGGKDMLLSSHDLDYEPAFHRHGGGNDYSESSLAPRSEYTQTQTDDMVISPFEVTAASASASASATGTVTGTATVISTLPTEAQPVPFTYRREKFAPSSRDSTIDIVQSPGPIIVSHGEHATETHIRDSNSIMDTRGIQLEGRLADLMHEIQLVQRAVQERRIGAGHDEQRYGDDTSDAPPSYGNNSEHAL